MALIVLCISFWVAGQFGRFACSVLFGLFCVVLICVGLLLSMFGIICVGCCGLVRWLAGAVVSYLLVLCSVVYD